MANKVNIGLSIEGVLEKYGLDRKYIAGFRASDTFDSVVQEVVTIQTSDTNDAVPTNITSGIATFDAGDIIYVENTSTSIPGYLGVVVGGNDYTFSSLRPQQGIAVIAHGLNVPQLSIEADSGTITVNVVVFRSSF